MSKKLAFSMGLILIIITLVSGSGVVHLTASTGSEVVLFVDPEVTSVELGQVFTLDIRIANVENLYRWTMSLRWDPSIIELDPVSTSAVTEGPFLKNVGRTYFIVASYTAGSGYLSYINSELTQPTSASGSGILLTIRFKAVNKGETTITINDSVLYDFSKQRISHTCKSGRVSVESVVRDLAVKLDSPSSLVLGKSALLNATATNVGDVDITNANLAILINGNVGKSETISSLKVGSLYKLSFLWTPSSSGMYNITAYVTPVPGETRISNNVDTSLINVVSMVHDVAVSLEAPTHLVLGDSITLNATVTNVGAYDETNVKASIIINGVTWKSETIAFLAVGSSRRLTLQWQPDQEGKHNITAYVHPVAGETLTLNNRESTFVNVVDPSARSEILIVSGDSGSWYERGTSLDRIEDALSSAGFEYDVWKISENGRPSLDLLLKYELVVWTVGDYSSKAVHRIDAETLKEYLSLGGNILIEGQFLTYESPPTYSDLCESVLHVSFHGYNLKTTGLTVTDPDHPITHGLPLNITWEWIGRFGPDAVKPSKGAYQVMGFAGNGYTAVNVFDGTQEGRGSVIYYNFALHWMPQTGGNILVINSIEWLMRKGVSVVASNIIHASENAVHFIYTDLSAASKVDDFCMLAGSMVYAICENLQHQIFDTNQDWILSSGRLDPTKLRNSTVAVFGTPLDNKLVRYYETETDLPPVRFYNNSEHFAVLNRAGETIISMSIENVTSGHSDAFVIYVFTEPETNNTFLVVYGFGWRGSWASGIYLTHFVSKNLPLYSESWYVFKWTDLNRDGVPELSEVTLESSG